jgi:hypothetical protein
VLHLVMLEWIEFWVAAAVATVSATGLSLVLQHGRIDNRPKPTSNLHKPAGKSVEFQVV